MTYTSFLFSFHFTFEDEPLDPQGYPPAITCGFIVDGLPQQLSSLHEDPYDEGVVSSLESQYGIHDWAGNGDDTMVNGLQFMTYEVSRLVVPDLMEEWRLYFLGKGLAVTDVVDITQQIGSEEATVDYIRNTLKRPKRAFKFTK